MTSEKQELINNVVMSCLPVMTEEQADHLRSALLIHLNNYEIKRVTTDIVEYQGNQTEMLLRKFLVAKRVNGCTPRTIQCYGEYLNRQLREFNKPLAEITTDDIRYYLAVKETRDGISKVSLNNERRILSVFFEFLRDEEIITKNPIRGIARIKEPKHKKKAFTELEIEKLRECCNDNRSRCMMEVMLSTGCRVSELVDIRLDEIGDDSIVVHGKGQKDRICYLNAKAIMSINNYIKDRSDENPYLFASSRYNVQTRLTKEFNRYSRSGTWWQHPELVHESDHLDKGSVENIINKLGKRAEVENTYPHRFRRTCATMALRHGMPIEQVSKMLGHEQLDTTQIYLDLSDEDLKMSHKKYVV